MNVFSRLRNLSWPGPSCNYQMNDNDIRLGYTNLRGILDSKRTIRYKSISDILISMFSGINKCSQGRNIFVIDFGSPRYQKFVISLICVSAEFPTYNVSDCRNSMVFISHIEYRSSRDLETDPLFETNQLAHPVLQQIMPFFQQHTVQQHSYTIQ